ncbi:MAG: hypothetical protein FJ214_04160 [Ignavibacteria bacterium]|nr:hypothetical protein [Ignavibacteria bacterium]
MIKSFLSFIVISVLIITNSCNSPTEPEPLPGRFGQLQMVLHTIPFRASSFGKILFDFVTFLN